MAVARAASRSDMRRPGPIIRRSRYASRACTSAGVMHAIGSAARKAAMVSPVRIGFALEIRDIASALRLTRNAGRANVPYAGPASELIFRTWPDQDWSEAKSGNDETYGRPFPPLSLART